MDAGPGERYPSTEYDAADVGTYASPANTGQELFVTDLLPPGSAQAGVSDGRYGRHQRARAYPPDGPNSYTVYSEHAHDLLYSQRRAAWDALDSSRGYAIGPKALETAVVQSNNPFEGLDRETVIELRLGALQEASERISAGVPTLLIIGEDRPMYIAGVPDHDGLSVGAEIVPFQSAGVQKALTYFTMGINDRTEINAADTVHIWPGDEDATPRAASKIRVVSGDAVAPHLSSEVAASVREYDALFGSGISPAQTLTDQIIVRAHMMDVLIAAQEVNMIADVRAALGDGVGLHMFAGDALLDTLCQGDYAKDSYKPSLAALDELWPANAEETLADYIMRRSHEWRSRYPGIYSRQNIAQLLTDRFNMDLLDVLDKIG